MCWFPTLPSSNNKWAWGKIGAGVHPEASGAKMMPHVVLVCSKKSGNHFWTGWQTCGCQCFRVTGISLVMVLLKLWEESTGRLELIKPWLQNEASATVIKYHISSGPGVVEISMGYRIMLDLGGGWLHCREECIDWSLLNTEWDDFTLDWWEKPMIHSV